MENIHTKLIALLVIAFVFNLPGYSQDGQTNELRFEVNKLYPSVSITKENLKEAQTLTDLNANYPSSWVKEYISVEILTSHRGKIKKAAGEKETLSREQKDHMKNADVGTDISVNVKYIPDNNLKQNDAKEINFTFSVDPDNDATYPGGQQKLNQYIKANAIDKIPDGTFVDYDLAAVKFTINEDGKITNANVVWPFKDEKTDGLLLETISNMPRWKPAEYSNGLKVKQEFVLTFGNHENCMINTLSIRRFGPAKGE